MKHVLLITCLFCMILRVSAQSGQVLPVQFSQFYQNYSLVHPAATGMYKSYQIFIGHQSQTGAFQGVNTSYSGINFKLKGKDSLGLEGHGFGLNIVNNREGYYFNRERLAVSYAYHNQIFENWVLSGGISVGAINYIYRASDISAGGSAFKPSADVGLFLYKPEDINIGFTISQVIPGNMSPLERQLKIKSYLNLSVDKVFRLSPYFSLRPAVMLRGPFEKGAINADFTMLAIIQDLLSAGINYKANKGIAFVGGINDIKMGSAGFNLFISYYNSFAAAKTIRPSVIELSCVFKRRRFMDEEEVSLLKNRRLLSQAIAAPAK
ncbi:MAG: PorP/SprF family type IX secretion system membrane protein [Cytophagaceae bacterium]